MKNKKANLLSILLFFIGLTGLQCQTVKDIDGNIYKTIIIGKQTWMAENLKTTRLNDGGAIPQVTEVSVWEWLEKPGYCWYKNDESTYKNTYGALYNWFTVKTEKLCPAGWHVPSDSEWTALLNLFGGVQTAGGKLKEKGTAHWKSPNTDATNEAGFSGLPGGKRTPYFEEIGEYGNWWSSTAFNEGYLSKAWTFRMYFNFSNVQRTAGTGYKSYGYSVRCIKD